ncbi:hypothetical protein [Desulfovirgula thermocuniculi]|uniref:hypothetical protein n=1 Tax=Desulfovirgula thermocuniculi TaxID=348842 RepID=UPI0003FC51DE|nr:hypothetical protein [Desulfovirgula thermocuniculi]
MAKPQLEVVKKIPAAKEEPAKAPAAPRVEVSPEQLTYANILLYGSWAGIILLVLANIIYFTGVIKPYLPPHKLPQYWGMKASQFVEVARMPHGWGWVKMLGYSDFLNYIGIALLAGLTILGYLVLLPAYLAKRDWPYTVIVLVEVLVLVLAASGLLAVGAH